MERHTTTQKQLTKALVLLIVLLAAVIGAFIRFLADNKERINAQNQSYLEDMTDQSVIMTDRLFNENLNYIRSTAFLYSQTITSAEPDYELIAEFENSTGFERLRFIGADGSDYTSKGLAANVFDRDYFKSGMKGITGVTCVLSSRVTNETQIGFYSPVKYQGEIIGVMVGFYGESFIRELIDYEIFDHAGEGWLCLSDGTVIFTTSEDTSVNFLDRIQGDGFSQKDRDNIRQAFAERGESLYTRNTGGGSVIGYIAGLHYADWMLVQSFPPGAETEMIYRADKEGAELLVILTALFVVYAGLLVAGFLRRKKALVEESRNSDDISAGVQKLFGKFQIVDTESETFRYIYGQPDDAGIGDEGSYDSFLDALLDRIKDPAERQETAEAMSLPRLRKRFARTDMISLRLHAPIRNDEWFTYNMIALEREQKRVKRFLIIRQDVTDLHRKELQEQERLRAALNEVSRANKAKSEFLSNMSRDIRTPMNGIMDLTAIASDHIGDQAAVQDCLEKISGSVAQLLTLINDILDMSSIESGRMTLDPVPRDLTRVVRRAADMISVQAKEKGLELEVSLGELGHSWARVDDLRLGQVLMNIAGNAVRYTPKGGTVTIGLTERPMDELNSEYVFTVKDTGIGISEEFLPHVFEAFTREPGSAAEKIPGTGLGLAISGQLVRLMDGTIKADSRQGEGSLFTVTLPLEHAEPEEDSVPFRDTDTDRRFDGVRLLLAEDNDINARIAGYILREHGFVAERCTNGQEAVDLLREKGPDRFSLVLMDVQMPVMNGYEAARAIRALDTGDFSGLPIIAMTAGDAEKERDEALSSGMNACISKPFEPEELIAALNALLR